MTTTTDLIAEGITTRRIEYWIKSGYLKVDSPGSGVNREWPELEVRVARLMNKLAEAGLLPKVAAALARRAAMEAGRVSRFEIRPGVWIEVAA